MNEGYEYFNKIRKGFQWKKVPGTCAKCNKPCIDPTKYKSVYGILICLDCVSKLNAQLHEHRDRG